jgi:hypothetical protein
VYWMTAVASSTSNCRQVLHGARGGHSQSPMSVGQPDPDDEYRQPATSA